jgi:hypothetical protein
MPPPSRMSRTSHAKRSGCSREYPTLEGDGRPLKRRAVVGGKALGHHRREVVVVHEPGGGHHDVARVVPGPVEVADRFGSDRPHRLRGPEHRPPQRVGAEEDLGEDVEDQVVGRVVA